jgi:hypothetical protein
MYSPLKIVAVTLCLACLVPLHLFAQCQSQILAALDESELSGTQHFSAAVWTLDSHCPASGNIMITSNPPGAAVLGDYVESFFDIFTEVYSVKPPIASNYTPNVPFEIITQVTYSDPVYPPQTYVEQVVRRPTGRLEIFRPTPCAPVIVPASIAPGNAACLQVCHNIYYVDLGSTLTLGKPVIQVTPGCTGSAAGCPPTACNPGGLIDYRFAIYERAGRWILEFEYSNPLIQPVCYCVAYIGNLPLNYLVTGLAALNSNHQTFDLTVWTGGLGQPACGMLELFSYPAGAYIGNYEPAMTVNSVPQTVHFPVGAGSFAPGQQFKLIAYVNYGPPFPCPDYTNQWFVENVQVLPNGGLQLIDSQLECSNGGGELVPPSLVLGQSACFRVCHKVYYIPLVFPGMGIPNIIVTPGCDMTTLCPPMPSCTPGGPSDFVYEVFRVGGTWMLRFEYSNPHNEPVCYCVQFQSISPQPIEAYDLAALDGSTQLFHVGLWGSDPHVPLSGNLAIRSNPPGALIGDHVQSFFDVFTEGMDQQIPVGPGTFLPGQSFQLIAHAVFNNPDVQPVTYTENVIVRPDGMLTPWAPADPCVGDLVPPFMVPGEVACFTVCHGIYRTILNYNPGGGRPVIQITPGCNAPCTDPTCLPGGPNDYCWRVYHDGINWILEFEYSNPYIQPVCYCVQYLGNVPFDCGTRELAALNEERQSFDITLWTFSHLGQLCPANGTLEIFSYPSGALIGPYPVVFNGVGPEWYTVTAPVAPGSFTPGSAFQLIARIDYTDPAYPDVWKVENVRVSEDAALLEIDDVGGQCPPGTDFVPSDIYPGQSTCFRVCHRIYYSRINWSLLTPPVVRVTPGCYGPPSDNCVTWTDCLPGGLWDYRYAVIYDGIGWVLEFEYSNPDIEPVCYCVFIEPPPCYRVPDLVMQWPDSITHTIRLAWTCPQDALYRIYSTSVKNNDGNPPGLIWNLDAEIWGTTGEQKIWTPIEIVNTDYKNYVIKADCGPFPTHRKQ